LVREMGLYSKSLLKKPRLVVLNKIDLLEDRKAISAFKRKFRKEVLTISCADGTGLELLKERLFQEVAAINAAPSAPEES
jgi:GTPase